MTVYVQVKLGRPHRHGPFVIHALDYCLGVLTERATVVHVRGRCDGDVAFAGCVVVTEGRAEPAHDLKTYGQPRDTAALALAVEACLAEHTAVLGDELRRICE